MKNLFGMNRYNEQKDGEKFIVKKLGGELARKQSAFEKEEVAFNKTAMLPAWISIPALIMTFAGLIALLVFFEIFDEDTSFAQAMERVGWLFITGIVLFAAGGGITAWNMIKAARATKTPAYAYLKERARKLNRECYDELGVPEDAKTIDVTGVAYKKKNGAADGKLPWNASYSNVEAAFYADADAIMFAFTDCVFAVPRARILSVKCVEKYISVAEWTKEEPFNKGRYKNYKIKKNGNSGNIMIKPYYTVICRDENYEEYQIIIPCYDAEPVVQAIGKPVE